MAIRFNSTIPSMEDFDENFTSLTTGTSSETTEAVELHPYGVLVTIACLWILIAVLGIIGNLLVILSVVLSKSVRTMTNVLVVNLSVADLWTSLSLPWNAVALLSDGTWPLPSLIPCQVAAFMWHTGLGNSLYNLALISVNRLVRITRPGLYSRLFTPFKMAIIVTLSWLLSFFVILFPIAIGIGSLGHDLRDDTCTDQDLHAKADEYNLIQTIGFFPVPMLTVIISYLIIYIHVRRHFKKRVYKKSNSSSRPYDASQASQSSVVSMPTSGSDVPAVLEKNKFSRQQLQITKNLFLTFCAFSLCISPYFISLFIPSSKKFALYGATILLCNSCINPIIYTANHPQFMKVLRPMIKCRWSEIPQPSKALQYLKNKLGQDG
ncbi:G-protein coupled receptor moody-like [Asterias amurensis]|uniref:G-protein coupled receptor moody-like n=1 Tax=Asterias amurensis TaxID=7602 RepID=UPI003AB6B188